MSRSEFFVAKHKDSFLWRDHEGWQVVQRRWPVNWSQNMTIYIYIWPLGKLAKTLPEAQRTQKLTPWLGLVPLIPNGATWISSKFYQKPVAGKGYPPEDLMPDSQPQKWHRIIFLAISFWHVCFFSFSQSVIVWLTQSLIEWQTDRGRW